MKNIQKMYDEDYFEHGLIVEKSCYMNYSWMPEQTLRMAHYFVTQLPIEKSDKVLDFGCAKGFLVKALRILDVEAYGVDVSEYAIKNADGQVRGYCRLNDGHSLGFGLTFDWVITKDVLEHIPVPQLKDVLKAMAGKSKKMFAIVPLASNNNGNGFIISEYNRDVTHVTVKNMAWWKKFVSANGWDIMDVAFHFKGCKESWVEKHPKGNVFMRLKSKLF